MWNRRFFPMFKAEARAVSQLPGFLGFGIGTKASNLCGTMPRLLDRMSPLTSHQLCPDEIAVSAEPAHMKETAYLLQAALISAWWVGLASSETFFAAFQFDQIPPTAFWAFLAPDVIVIAALSAIRANRESNAIEYVILGAFGYASLFCVNATVLTASGYLPTILMLLGLAYNTLLCFNDSLFRRSSTNRMKNMIKTLIQIVCIWILTLVVIPYVILDAFNALFLPQFGIRLSVAVCLFMCFSLLGLTSCYFMVRDGAGTPLPLDQTNNLVVSGPYHYVRNPMAIAGIGQGLAIATCFQSVPIMMYSILGGLVWQLVVRPIEERDMTQRFGESYLEYCRRVSCWIPTFARRDGKGVRTY
jgi:protein-S-isoprenylcysteine O-methyltransferase Ste14